MATQDYAAEVAALKDDLKAVRKDIASLTQTVASNARSGIGHAAQSVRESAEAVGRATQQVGREGVAAVSRQVEANPIASILAAAAIGFLLGALLRRS